MVNKIALKFVNKCVKWKIKRYFFKTLFKKNYIYLVFFYFGKFITYDTLLYNAIFICRK